MMVRNDRMKWLKGPQMQCSVVPPGGTRPFHLVLLGAPGVGKGTQAELLSAHLGACHLSTGDIFRVAKRTEAWERTPVINEALEYMRKGELIPDSTVLSVVAERVECLRCRGGFLLDGFPRTVAQAEALGAMLAAQELNLDAVINYHLAVDQIVARMSGRRTCSRCKAVYHATARPPRVEGICNHCGGQLYQREDDLPDSVRVRMAVYEQSTAPLAEYYRRRNLLVAEPADGVPEVIYHRTIAALAARMKH
jgi:adenylate kinase